MDRKRPSTNEFEYYDMVLINEDDDCLEFVCVGDRVYRIFNRNTKRFHNLDLGIDWIT